MVGDAGEGPSRRRSSSSTAEGGEEGTDGADESQPPAVIPWPGEVEEDTAERPVSFDLHGAVLDDGYVLDNQGGRGEAREEKGGKRGSR